MRSPRKAKAARVGPAASVKRDSRPRQHKPRPPIRQRFQRSAVNWLLDAATFARDGDGAAAFLAACRALRVLRRATR